MLFESIIITGTSCAGKSTIAENLCNKAFSIEFQFEQVRAVTTREKRSGDTNYEYLDDEEFQNILSSKKLLVNSSYRGKKYGIKKATYQNVLNKKSIPVLVITPSSAAELLAANENKYLCLFLDADDEILYERWLERLGKKPTRQEEKAFRKGHELDRSFQDYAHYIINSIDIESTVKLISLLWKYQDHGGALSQEVIKQMIACGILLRNANPKMVNGASYDLRLGDEYYYDGKIRKLSPENPFLTIEPYDYAIVSCKETACMPRDVIAKFGLSVGLFCQGIILSNGPQVDPGFRGTLFCLLFNTSNRAVHLKRGMHYATIEFNKLLGYATSYSGKYQDKESIINYIPPNALHGAINELKKEVEQLKQESHTMQNIYLGVVGLMFAIISILLVLR